jgi:hypothetical protein
LFFLQKYDFWAMKNVLFSKNVEISNKFCYNVNPHKKRIKRQKKEVILWK